MKRRPPRSTRTAPPCPYTALFRSGRSRPGASARCADHAGRVRRMDDQPRSGVASAAGRARLAVAVLGASTCGRHRDELYRGRSEEHTSELQSLMRISYAVFSLKKKTLTINVHNASHYLKKLI